MRVASFASITCTTLLLVEEEDDDDDDDDDDDEEEEEDDDDDEDDDARPLIVASSSFAIHASANNLAMAPRDLVGGGGGALPQSVRLCVFFEDSRSYRWIHPKWDIFRILYPESPSGPFLLI
jgi:hypothetical protein